MAISGARGTKNQSRTAPGGDRAERGGAHFEKVCRPPGGGPGRRLYYITAPLGSQWLLLRQAHAELSNFEGGFAFVGAPPMRFARRPRYMDPMLEA